MYNRAVTNAFQCKLYSQVVHRLRSAGDQAGVVQCRHFSIPDHALARGERRCARRRTLVSPARSSGYLRVEPGGNPGPGDSTDQTPWRANTPRRALSQPRDSKLQCWTCTLYSTQCHHANGRWRWRTGCTCRLGEPTHGSAAAGEDCRRVSYAGGAPAGVSDPQLGSAHGSHDQ